MKLLAKTNCIGCAIYLTLLFQVHFEARAEEPQSSNAEWLLPYLSDGIDFVELYDIRRLGPFSKFVPRYLADGPRLPDLLKVKRYASLRGGNDVRRRTGVMLIECHEAPDDKFLSQVDEMLRPNLGRIKRKIEGRTVCVGTPELVDVVWRKPSAQGKLADTLRQAGDHLYVSVTTPLSEEVAAAIAGAAVRADSLEIRWVQLLLTYDRTTLTFDVEPRLQFQVKVVAPAEQVSDVHADADKLLHYAKSRLDQNNFLLFTHRLVRTVGVEMMESGQLKKTPQGAEFQWSQTEETTQKLLDRIPHVIKEVEAFEADVKRRAALKNTSNALLIHANRYDGRFPTLMRSGSGKPTMSWRVGLLPCLGYEDVYLQLRLKEPWDSPHNRKVLQQIPPRLFAGNPKTPDGHADTLAVIGKDFGFLPNKRGDAPIVISDVKDWMENTAMLVEVDPALSVPWAKPDDYVWDESKPTAGLGAKEEPFFRVSCGDTRMHRVSRNESAATLKALFGRSDGQEYQLKPVK